MTAENAEVHYRHGDPCRILEEAGFAPGQARALLDLIADRESRLVTSESMTAYENDVARVDRRMSALATHIGSLEAKMDARFGSLEAKMDARFGSLEAKMDGRIGSLEGKMDGVLGELRTLKWTLGILVGVVAAVGAPVAAAMVRLAFFA